MNITLKKNIFISKYFNNYREGIIISGDLEHKLHLWQVSRIYTKGPKNSNIKLHCIYCSLIIIRTIGIIILILFL